MSGVGVAVTHLLATQSVHRDMTWAEKGESDTLGERVGGGGGVGGATRTLTPRASSKASTERQRNREAVEHVDEPNALAASEA